MSAYNTIETTEREIIVRRLLNAPRELVWKAWTQPEHLIQWWGPRGFTNTFQEYELKPGGKWRFIMHGPDGTDYPNLVVFTEVVPPERIAFTHGTDDSNPDVFRTLVTLVAKGDKTELTMHAIFPSAEVLAFAVKEHGAIEGGKETIDRLEEQLAKMTLSV